MSMPTNGAKSQSACSGVRGQDEQQAKQPPPWLRRDSPSRQEQSEEQRREDRGGHVTGLEGERCVETVAVGKRDERQTTVWSLDDERRMSAACHAELPDDRFAVIVLHEPTQTRREAVTSPVNACVHAAFLVAGASSAFDRSALSKRTRSRTELMMPSDASTRRRGQVGRCAAACLRRCDTAWPFSPSRRRSARDGPRRRAPVSACRSRI